MKQALFLISVIGCLTGCGYQARELADKQFKDSLALAEGNKVLGNFRFGTPSEDFIDDYLQFLVTNKRTVYGIPMWKIDPSYTQDNRLHSLTFVSKCLVERSDENPFVEFANKKFGRPTIGKNIWVVGDRRITLESEIVYKDYYTEEFVPNVNLKEDRAKYEYYNMIISSDSLSRIAEQHKNEELDQLYERQRKEKQEQKDKALQTL